MQTKQFKHLLQFTEVVNNSIESSFVLNMGDLVYVLLDLFTAAAYLQKILQFVHAHISLLVFIDL